MKTNSELIGVGCDALFAVALPDTRGRHCYLTDGDGDPPRTYTPELATSYDSEAEAEAAIVEARKTTPFRDRTFMVVQYPAWDSGLDEGDLHSSANAEVSRGDGSASLNPHQTS